MRQYQFDYNPNYPVAPRPDHVRKTWAILLHKRRNNLRDRWEDMVADEFDRPVPYFWAFPQRMFMLQQRMQSMYRHQLLSTNREMASRLRGNRRRADEWFSQNGRYRHRYY